MYLVWNEFEHCKQNWSSPSLYKRNIYFVRTQVSEPQMDRLPCIWITRWNLANIWLHQIRSDKQRVEILRHFEYTKNEYNKIKCEKNTLRGLLNSLVLKRLPFELWCYSKTILPFICPKLVLNKTLPVSKNRFYLVSFSSSTCITWRLTCL